MSNFDKIINSKLKDFQQTPPKELLNNIRSKYPKKTLYEHIIQNKYYIIACITVIIGSILFFNTTESNNNRKISHNTSNIKKINSRNYLNNPIVFNSQDSNQNIKSSNNTNKLSTNSSEENLIKPIIKYYKAFRSNDTSICGKSIYIQITDSLSNYSFPGLKTKLSNNTICLTSPKSGKYYAFYYKETGNTILKDSISITFKDITTPKIIVSDKDLCYGEKLIINISNNNNLIIKDLDHNISKIGNKQYEISDLYPGNNKIQLMFTNSNNCTYVYNENIIMQEKPNYNIQTKPAYCSNKNGEIIIESINMKSPKYTLNENYQYNDGNFSNLNPGIYFLRIEYSDQCYTYDTLLVRDSLNISPYFTIEKDLVDANKYHAYNMTRLDNQGYEQNNDIQFEWRINNTPYISKDNPEFEFDSKGEYLIELIASLNDNCVSTYSETIHVTKTVFLIPNIFTPNADGIGDYFKIKAETEINNFHIQIINKLGEIVYESNNIQDNWNGKINGNNDASEGLYYYIIRGEDMFENKIEQKGAIQLVRN